MNGTSATTTILGPSTYLEPSNFVPIAAWFIFAIWIVYTVIAAYHWFRYGHQSMIAIPALIAHVVVSLSLALFAVSGFN